MDGTWFPGQPEDVPTDFDSHPLTIRSSAARLPEGPNWAVNWILWLHLLSNKDIYCSVFLIFGGCHVRIGFTVSIQPPVDAAHGARGGRGQRDRPGVHRQGEGGGRRGGTFRAPPALPAAARAHDHPRPAAGNARR